MRRPFSPLRLMRAAADVAEGLSYLHELKPSVLHRDVSQKGRGVKGQWTDRVEVKGGGVRGGVGGVGVGGLPSRLRGGGEW